MNAWRYMTPRPRSLSLQLLLLEGWPPPVGLVRWGPKALDVLYSTHMMSASRAAAAPA